MKPKSYSILLDIYKGVLNNNQLIEFTTGDNGQSVLEFVLLEDKITAYNLDGCMVRMVIEGQQQDCTIVDASNGKVKIVLLQSMFSRPGNVMAEIQIYDSSDQTLRLTTPRFQYNVRKSLMNNTTVQADPNYSILQNMILEVSSADEVAKQAKKTAESAMTTANQAESKANQIIDNGNYAKEQGDYAKAEGDRLQGMLTIDGTAQTKFDFIKNQVMKDGLIGSAFCIKTTTTVSCPSLDAKNGTIIVNADFENISFLFDAGLFTLRKKLEWNRYQLSTNPTNPLVETVYGHKCFIVVSLLDGILSMSQTINGVTEIKKCDLKTEGIINSLSMFYGSKLNDASVLVYNRQLTTQEIQHIFQVLNNPESIKELRTTDSEGKTSILKLASDEDHVEMSTGRTLREEYMGVLKTMGKDFTSSDGSPVEVNNGIEARVISGEIKGQTVKNYAKTIERSSFSSVTGQTKIDDMNNIITIDTPTEYSNCFLKKGAELLPNTKYKVVLIILENTLSGPFSINNGAHSGTVFAGSFDLPKGSTGVKEFMFTTKSDVSGDIILRMFAGVGSGRIKLQAMVVEENATTPTSYIPFGLSSTQTIISNNGQQYPIYANEEDKANKKVISLYGIGESKDSLDVKDDGTGVLTKNVLFTTANSNTWTKAVETDTMVSFGTPLLNAKGFNNSIVATCICDPLKVFATTAVYNATIKGIAINQNGWLYLSVLKTDLVTLDSSGVNTWLTNVGFKLWYQLATPIVTHIPKELVPTILTHKTNILEVGGAVKPSSFKVTVPVDRIAEIEARLQALESTTVDVVLNK